MLYDTNETETTVANIWIGYWDQ